MEKPSDFFARLGQFGVPDEAVGRMEEQLGARVGRVEDWGALWQRLASEVDDSDYGWAEWVEAFLLLDGRIVATEDHSNEPDWERVWGYVGCTAAGPGGVAFGETLPERVIEAYNSYGFVEED